MSIFNSLAQKGFQIAGQGVNPALTAIEEGSRAAPVQSAMATAVHNTEHKGLAALKAIGVGIGVGHIGRDLFERMYKPEALDFDAINKAFDDANPNKKKAAKNSVSALPTPFSDPVLA